MDGLLIRNEIFMIDKNVVRNLVEEWLQDKEYFLVDVEISPDDRDRKSVV